MMKIKTAGQFVDLVAQMREAQKQYFKTRYSGDLQTAKNLERKVDDAIRQHKEHREEKKNPGLGM